MGRVEKTPAQMWPYLRGDRPRDSRAGVSSRFSRNREARQVAEIFDGMYDLRQQIAKNPASTTSGITSTRRRNRFDYTPDDCFRFHESVDEVCGPRRSGCSSGGGALKCRPVAAMGPVGRPKAGRCCNPTRARTTSSARARDIFENVEPDFKAYFQRMADAGLLDLENRKGKAPGGYCQTLPIQKLPLIFMNAVNIDEDVRTLLHEAGHSFPRVRGGQVARVSATPRGRKCPR